ncbi:MAG: hypothetical protein U1E10_11065 [Bdellovibrionales bacterium]|nr:hypothetical protein [Bdellovibrionales bacterium]
MISSPKKIAPEFKKLGTLVGLSVAAALLIFTSADFASSRVPFVRDCPGKDSGDWNWGEAPSACEAARFGEVSRIKFIYSDFALDRTRGDDPEHRKDYVTNMHALLRELSMEYIKAKNPSVSQAEADAFALAIEAVAHQETYWSHYRVGKDGRYKMMVGDKNVSHGIMQINMNYHASKEDDRSFDLVGNIGFGVELFHRKWESAAKARCTQRAKKQTDAQYYQNITRAAYSAYNGGSDAVCRWTNPKHTWAKNDKNFFGKLKDQSWSEWVRVEDQKIRIDVGCIRSGDEICAVAQPRKTESIANRPLVLDDGMTCVMSHSAAGGGQLECARDYRIAKCLVAQASGISSGPDSTNLNVSGAVKMKSTDPEISKLKRHVHTDRMALCGKAHPTAALVGDVVKLNQNVGIRMKVEGGVTIANAKKGQMFQVIDVELPFDSLGNRLYKVMLSPTSAGWISAGPTADGEKVLSVLSRSTAPVPKGLKTWLPTAGSNIEVAKLDGVKLMVSQDGEVKTTLAKGDKAIVEEVKILGAANEIWLRVKTASETGYIYSGSTYPTMTVDQWVKVK